MISEAVCKSNICEDCIRRESCSGPQWCEYAEHEDYEIDDEERSG